MMVMGAILLLYSVVTIEVLVDVNIVFSIKCF